MRKMIKRKNKLGVSLMVSYVLLISITIVLSVGVYMWLKDYSNIDEKISCKEDTSLIIKDYNVFQTGANKTLKISLKNNGNFNIDGFLITAGNDSKRVPIKLLQVRNQPNPEGYFDFNDKLILDEIEIAKFNLEGLNKLEIIQIQPFIYKDDKIGKIFCEQALIKQNILVNPSVIPGLVSWWKFDGNVLDSGSDNDGIITGNPIYIDGKLSNGLEFNGMDEYVSFDVASLETVAFWYKNSSIDWTHIVYNSTTTFINGELGVPNQYPIRINGNLVEIGKFQNDAFFKGIVDEVAIYSKSLTEWEIIQLYNSYSLS